MLLVRGSAGKPGHSSIGDADVRVTRNRYQMKFRKEATGNANSSFLAKRAEIKVIRVLPRGSQTQTLGYPAIHFEP